jgi:hypothetical protein
MELLDFYVDQMALERFRGESHRCLARLRGSKWDRSLTKWVGIKEATLLMSLGSAHEAIQRLAQEVVRDGRDQTIRDAASELAATARIAGRKKRK